MMKLRKSGGQIKPTNLTKHVMWLMTELSIQVSSFSIMAGYGSYPVMVYGREISDIIL